MVTRNHLAPLFLAANALMLISCGGGDDETTGTDDDGGPDGSIDTATDADSGTDTELDSGPPGDEAIWVSAGPTNTCAVIEGGYVKCWGWQQYGELGYGNDCVGDTDANSSLPSTLPFLRVGGAVAKTDNGGYHSCAVLENGTAKCWGWNIYGQLGIDASEVTTIGEDDVPADHDPIDFDGKDALRVSTASGNFTCALLEGGEVRCFGDGMSGQTGGGEVVLDGPATQVCTGAAHTCAVLESGDVYCWGYGGAGVLGYGNTENVYVPLDAGPVDIGGSAVQVACGYYHTCALLDTGDVVCWGSGEYGALGYGNTDTIGDDEVPASVGPVDIGDGVTQITAGNQRTCVLLESEAVKCWGSFGGGALGYGNQENIGDDEVPADVGAVDIGEPVVRVDSGYAHNCALGESGSIYCWGLGQYGRLGYGNEESIGDDETPADVGPVPLL